MRVHAAQLPAASNDDRVLITDQALIVLDGATSHDPEMPGAGAYVDTLGQQLQHQVHERNDLREALAAAITRTADLLTLRPGTGPCSTVAIARVGPRTLDVLVLGDSSIIVGTNTGTTTLHTDDRLARLGLAEADQYRERLAHGHGYDDTHRRMLAALQRAERQRRNRRGGYWIAEADPVAARHAVTATYPRHAAQWAIVATDGATDTAPLAVNDWPSIAATAGTAELVDLLHRCRDWEAIVDPSGTQLPRSKRHDDKTLAVLHM
ncbi:hypothetical protein [Nocardia brasiliensis]